MQFSFFLIESETKLIYFKIAYGAQVVFYFLFYLHASQIQWTKPPKLITFIGWGWALVILILISMWSIMTFEKTQNVVIFNMPRSYTAFYPDGAGVTLFGHFLLGTSYRLVSDLYRIFVICLLLYSYYLVKPINETPRIKMARRLWLIAGGIHLLYLFTILPWGIVSPWPGVLNFISSILIVIITIFIPEAALISRVQLLRANKLYNKITQTRNLTHSHEPGYDYGNDHSHGFESIVSYLDNLPLAIKEMLEQENAV
jgi:hypothetical protein